MESEFPAIPTAIMTVLGVIAPVLIQLVTKLVINERIRFLISLSAAAVTGMIAMLISGMPLAATPEVLGLWFTWTSILFKLVWKPIWKRNGSKLNAPVTTY